MDSGAAESGKAGQGQRKGTGAGSRGL